jgi:hypothetical protein
MNARPPLTHQDILARVEPLVRAGRAVDLAASDRLQRRIAFRPIEHPARPAGPDGRGLPALVETLQLEDGEGPGGSGLRLTRTFTTGSGLQARTIAEGPEAGELLARIEAVPAADQVILRGDATVVLTQVLQAAGPVLRAAEARVAGLALGMEVSRVSGYPAELTLRGPGEPTPRWPPDLLAVLGRPWDRLRRTPEGWVANLQLRGREPQRSADACARLLRTVDHLATTLAEPPARFHARHRMARWGVALRDTLPLLTGLAVVGIALYVQRQGSGAEPILALLANAAPPILMLLFFMRREMPRLELPRVPRRLRPDAWAPLAAQPAAAPPGPAAPHRDTRCSPTP